MKTFLVSIINVIIRVLFGWLMFVMLSKSFYLLASVCLLCTLKKDWIICDTRYGNKIYLGFFNK